MKKYITLCLFIFFCIEHKAQKESLIALDQTTLSYRTFGKGPPILIINGGPGMNSNGFADLAKKLSEKNLTIIYDQRGTGKSTLIKTDSTTITLDLMINDIESLRKKLSIKSWIVLGHSFGGMIASYYATLYPQRIDKLILSSSGGIDLDLLNYVNESIHSKLSPSEKDSLALWNKKLAEGDTSHYARLQRGKALAHAYVFNSTYLPVIAERLTQGNARINALIWSDLNKITFDCSDKLKNFSKPVLIIQGKQDIIFERTALKAQSVLKNSRFVLMDRCVHYGWLDRPDQYFSEISLFLNSEKKQ